MNCTKGCLREYWPAVLLCPELLFSYFYEKSVLCVIFVRICLCLLVLIIIPSACRQHRHHQYLQYLCNNNIHHAGIQTDYIWHQWGLFGEKYCKKLHLNSAVRQVKWKCRWIETAIAENTTTELQSNWENREHQKYFWNIIVLHEKSQSGLRN